MLQVTVSRRNLIVLTAVVALIVSVAWVGVAQRVSAASATPVVYVATGENFPDALGAASAAAVQASPVLLVSKTSIPSETRDELVRLNPDVIYVAGGTAVVSDAVFNELKAYAGTVTRVAGANRYATAVEVSKSAFPASGHNHDTDYLALDGTAQNADRLDGLSANQLARVEEGGGSGYWWPNNDDQYMTATITVPQPGYIFATGSTTIMARSGSSDAGECLLSSKLGGSADFDGYVAWDVADTDGARKEICTPVALFTAYEAGTYEIGLEFNGYDSTKATMWWGRVVAMYLPFDGNGSKP